MEQDKMEQNKIVKDTQINTIAQYPLSLGLLLLSKNAPEWLNNFEREEFFRLVVFYTIAQSYDIPTLKMFLDNYVKYRVSVNKAGREDLIRALKSSTQKILQSFFDKIKNIRETPIEH